MSRRSKEFPESGSRSLDHPAYWTIYASVDHVTPGSRGGDWLDPENLATACRLCEYQKSDQLLTELHWELLAPVANLSYNFVATVRDLDSGGHAMLKIGVPNPELASEMAALAHYAGIGACQLLKADPALGALLLEHIQPGHTLNTVADDEEATRIAARVMAALTGGPDGWSAGQRSHLRQDLP